jgi:dynamin-binding protein
MHPPLDVSLIPRAWDACSGQQPHCAFQEEEIKTIGIVNPALKGRLSNSISADDSSSRLRLRPADLTPRGRGLSLNSEGAPSLPTPDFLKRNSGQLTISPSASSIPSPHQFYYRDYYSGLNGNAQPGSGSSIAPSGMSSIRPSTAQSHDSGGRPRQSTDSGTQARRYSNSPYTSPHQASSSENQRFSGLFQSALPLSDSQERQPRPSQASSSRASSRERQPINGYNVLWLAASLFEFNIETTKHEAGYPYLTYQAGEVCISPYKS